MSADENQSGGIKSLDAALRVLSAISSQDGPLQLSDIARACKMPASKVHRYLASFHRAGLVRREVGGGRYDLGPEAMQLGLAAIARHDFVNHTADELPELSAITGMTVLLSVWGNEGATVVRWERGVSPTVTSMGLGTTLPLLNSATGRAFLAWAPPAQIERLKDAELGRAAKNAGLHHDFKPTATGVSELVSRIRAGGYASVDGRFIPGLVAAAAPVMDWQNEAQAVVTLVGTDPRDLDPASEPIQRLLSFCAGHSVQRRSA